MVLRQYLDKKYATPQKYQGRFPGSKVIIIGTGNSTAGLIKHKNAIRDVFDVVIGLNYATKDFEDIMDFRLIVEKKADGFLADLHNRKYKKSLVHIINWKSIDQYPKDLPLIKTTRSNFGFNPNIRKYKFNQEEGLLVGPLDSKGLSAGTAACQAIHLASIFGAAEIYLSGCDLVFKSGGDHYYGGNYYAKSITKPANRSPVVDVMFKNKIHKSTEFFVNSAKFIDFVIEKYCSKENISVFDFSDGLITRADSLDINNFFGV